MKKLLSCIVLVGLLIALVLVVKPRLETGEVQQRPVAVELSATPAEPTPEPTPVSAPEPMPEPTPEPTPEPFTVLTDYSDLPYVYHEKVPILMYHEVNDAELNGLYLSVADFRSQLDYMVEQGITPVTMEQLWEHWENQAPLPEKPIVLTFDDGYVSMYNTVFPILKEYGWPGTFYCISDAVYSEANLQVSMLEEMAAAGMEIGSHTKSHVELSGCTEEQLRLQLSESMEVLSEICGKDTLMLCYPSGKYNQAVKDMAEELGYRTAVTTEYGYANAGQDLFSLSRVRISRDMDAYSLAWALSELGY